MHDRADASLPTLSASMSKPMTSKPASTARMAKGRPTYPWPTTTTRCGNDALTARLGSRHALSHGRAQTLHQLQDRRIASGGGSFLLVQCERGNGNVADERVDGTFVGLVAGQS